MYYTDGNVANGARISTKVWSKIKKNCIFPKILINWGRGAKNTFFKKMLNFTPPQKIFYASYDHDPNSEEYGTTYIFAAHLLLGLRGKFVKDMCGAILTKKKKKRQFSPPIRTVLRISQNYDCYRKCLLTKMQTYFFSGRMAGLFSANLGFFFN